jgi:hypothetical protein
MTGATNYSPFELDFTSGTYTNGTVSVNVTNTQHPNDLSSTDYLSRYWTVESSGITDFSCDMIFHYVSEDIVGSEANIMGAAYHWGVWKAIGSASSLQFSGTKSFFGDISGIDSDLTDMYNLSNNNIYAEIKNGNLILHNSGNIFIHSVELIDISGKILYSNAVKNSYSNTIPLHVSSGYYIIKINAENTVFSNKVFIY